MTESCPDATGGPTPVKLELSRKESARFWAKVDRRGPDECWRWTGGTNGKADGNGYGNFRLRGGMVRAHRVSFEIHVHTLPPGQCALHTCDTPRCVNPAHLFRGTQSDNMADMAAKGRPGAGNMEMEPLPGILHPLHKLTESDVHEIRQRYAAGGVSQRALAKDYGVCQRTVTVIVNDIGWRHLVTPQV